MNKRRGLDATDRDTASACYRCLSCEIVVVCMVAAAVCVYRNLKAALIICFTLVGSYLVLLSLGDQIAVISDSIRR